MVRPKHCNLREAAEQIGIAPITLRRWLLGRKVKEVARDRNGWRVFTQSDVRRIRKFAATLIRPKGV
jgi:predicted site-specific integrase-resolvase